MRFLALGSGRTEEEGRGGGGELKAAERLVGDGKKDKGIRGVTIM